MHIASYNLWQLQPSLAIQLCMHLSSLQSEFRNAVGISDAVDLDDLLKLRCLKNENGEYCYHELENPILIDTSNNPVSYSTILLLASAPSHVVYYLQLLTCNLRTRRRLCSKDCKAVSNFVPLIQLLATCVQIATIQTGLILC